jgi:hypothetical protein
MDTIDLQSMRRSGFECNDNAKVKEILDDWMTQ